MNEQIKAELIHQYSRVAHYHTTQMYKSFNIAHITWFKKNFHKLEPDKLDFRSFVELASWEDLESFFSEHELMEMFK